MQVRQSANDPRLYNPSRDLAHNFGNVVERVAQRLEKTNWEDLNQLLRLSGVSEEELGQACQAYIRFVMGSARHPPPRDMGALMEQCGWNELPWGARIAYLATLGLVISGVYYVGIWEATAKGPAGPLLTEQELVARGQEVAQHLAPSKWKQRWGAIRRFFRSDKRGREQEEEASEELSTTEV